MASLIGQEHPWKQCLHLLETSCHIFLTGSAGSGKTTLVKDLLKHYATTRGAQDPRAVGRGDPGGVHALDAGSGSGDPDHSESCDNVYSSNESGCVLERHDDEQDLSLGHHR